MVADYNGWTDRPEAEREAQPRQILARQLHLTRRWKGSRPPSPNGTRSGAILWQGCHTNHTPSDLPPPSHLEGPPRGTVP
jgi:hypothetical protein